MKHPTRTGPAACRPPYHRLFREILADATRGEKHRTGRSSSKWIALGLAAATWTLAGLPSPAQAGDHISAKSLESHVRSLAADDFAGRGTGEPGIGLAEDYVASEFKKYGLRPDRPEPGQSCLRYLAADRGESVHWGRRSSQPAPG